MPTKKLILRLSSLGDVILATSALEALENHEQADWLLRREYRELIEHHERVRRVFLFERTPGFLNNLIRWIQLCRSLWQENYTDIFDLHRSIRTRLCHLLFIYWNVFGDQKARHLPAARWHCVKKEKWKLYGFYIFKRFWPKKYQPTPWVTRFAKLLGGSGKERPKLTHLIPTGFTLPRDLEKELQGLVLQGHKPSVPENSIDQRSVLPTYLCVMPSSRWNGKKWPIQYYVELLSKMQNSAPYLFPVILGALSDQESFLLSEELKVKRIPHFLGAGQWSLSQTAGILSQSQGYLGSDTGLAHLAEAVGVPAQILFGPTLPEMGFGPWRTQSHSSGAHLWCRPCGKDGRYCFRLTQRYACLTRLTPELVFQDRVQQEKNLE